MLFIVRELCIRANGIRVCYGLPLGLLLLPVFFLQSLFSGLISCVQDIHDGAGEGRLQAAGRIVSHAVHSCCEQGCLKCG